ncbi:MAG: hypothetical protein NTV04_13265, partial [Deltaproteobacteria bacterium]|nr:hypothetical protein [Deltaproteobacteria bacterium]
FYRGLGRNDLKKYDIIKSKADHLVKSHQNDGFDCTGVRPDAHDGRAAARPYLPQRFTPLDTFQRDFPFE